MVISTEQAIDRFKENESRIDKFVNQEGFYTTNTTPSQEVETLPSFMQSLITRYLAFSIRGDWSTGISFLKQDIVKQGGFAYVCLQDHT